MKHFRELVLLALLAFSASALAQEEIELKIYEVPPDNRDEIFSALQGLVGGAVQMLPTGQILARTTAEFHGQIATVLDAISKHVAEPTPRVTLQYWVVLGTAEAPGTDNTPAVLADVLDEIRDVHGPLAFRMLGNATLVTDSGMFGSTDGELNIRQTAYMQGERLHAELNIGFYYKVTVSEVRSGGQGQTIQPRVDFRQQGLNLNTSMEQGEFVVVGENSVSDNLYGEGEVDGTFFYIVHWPAAE